MQSAIGKLNVGPTLRENSSYPEHGMAAETCVVCGGLVEGSGRGDCLIVTAGAANSIAIDEDK